jgi:hypothetical protein
MRQEAGVGLKITTAVSGAFMLLALGACQPKDHPPTPPEAVDPPLVTGTPTVGGTLTASPGVWSGDPMDLVTTWSSCAGPDDPTTCVVRVAGAVSYEVPAADAGRWVVVEVAATGVGGTTTSRSASVGPITGGGVPVEHHCGPAAGAETWQRAVVHVFDCPLDVTGSVTVEAGAVLKLGVGTAFRVQPGGVVDLAGTAADPVVVTVLADDTVGGDTNADGLLAGAPPMAGWEQLLEFPNLHGGTGRLRHVDSRWVSSPVGVGVAADEVTIEDSTFALPTTRPGIVGWPPLPEGWIYVRGCGAGAVTGTTFDHMRVELTGCAVPVQGNRFVESPLAVANDDDLSLLDLNGGNSFAGTAAARAVRISGRVPAGTTVVFDDADVALLPQYVTVDGTMHVAAGSVLKLAERTAFAVAPGGVLDMSGTASAPVRVTVLDDDSIGGDANGDGTPSGAPTAHGELMVELPGFGGGTARLRHVDSRWVPWPLSAGVAAEELIIEDSSFDIPAERPTDGAWAAVAVGDVILRGCRTGAITGSTFSHMRVEATGCTIPIHGNVFTRSHNPLTVRDHDDLTMVPLNGPARNVVVGDGGPPVVTLGGRVPPGGTLVLDGPGTSATFVVDRVTASRSPFDARSEVDVRAGTVVKGNDVMFSLGPRTDFRALGTPTQPVVFTSLPDDAVGGDTGGDGPPSLGAPRLREIFDHNQGGVVEIAGAFFGVPLDRLGPGTVTVDHAVVRHTDSAFESCLVCRTSVTNTDFVDVGVGVSQAYYFMPAAPCQTLMGPEILDGGNPIWNPAVATSNYWDGPAPSINLDLTAVATATADADRLVNQLIEALEPADQAIVRHARDAIIDHYGNALLTLPLGPTTRVTAAVESCKLPIIEAGIPVVIFPVDTGNPQATPIHPTAALA